MVTTSKECEMMKSILSRSFHYTSSVKTDVRKTFARIRREQREQERARALAETEMKNKISPILKVGKSAA